MRGDAKTGLGLRRCSCNGAQLESLATGLATRKATDRGSKGEQRRTVRQVERSYEKRHSSLEALKVYGLRVRKSQLTYATQHRQPA